MVQMGAATNSKPASSALIQDAARQAGFDLCGIAPVTIPSDHVNAWRNWIADGHHGKMRYMERAERADLKRLAPWAKSIICLGLNYWLPEDRRGVPSTMVSIYAQGQDYHDVMKARMEHLLELLWQQLPEFEAKIYVDTGPILERAYAEAGGLGWIGKNTCLINEQRGSFFFLGEILTSLEFQAVSPAPDRCGSCTRCLDACPTGAFIAPYQLDARRCISYQTIELRGPIPEQDRSGVGTHIFGCDICQDVCPWNHRSSPTGVAEFLPLDILTRKKGATLEHLAQLSEEQFQNEFGGSPMKRPGYQGFLRNIAVALGNTDDKAATTVIESLKSNLDPLIGEHANWAVGNIHSRLRKQQ